MTSLSNEAAFRRQTLIEHLTEFRRCLIRSSIALAVTVLSCLYFSKDIFHFLQLPLLRAMPSGTSFIATSPLEALIIYLKVSLLTGVFVSSPFILYQVWLFVGPALYVKEKKMATAFVILTTLFFVGGALFGYFVIFPVGFQFFVGALSGTDIQFLPKMEDYFGFISRTLLTFGLIFEMPLIIVLLAQLKLVTLQMLNHAQRYVLVFLFLVAGVLTPGPDVLSQFLLAIPLLFLYELSVVFVWVLNKKKVS